MADTEQLKDKCPECDSGASRIMYGYPDISSEKLKKDLDEGKVTLGGCVITSDGPVWECRECGHQFS